MAIILYLPSQAKASRSWPAHTKHALALLDCRLPRAHVARHQYPWPIKPNGCSDGSKPSQNISKPKSARIKKNCSRRGFAAPIRVLVAIHAFWYRKAGGAGIYIALEGPGKHVSFATSSNAAGTLPWPQSELPWPPSALSGTPHRA